MGSLDRRTRPAWGCLDHGEIQSAAAGQPVESGVREHLSTCADCRRAVQELRRELGQVASHSELRPHGSSRLRRRLLWLVLLAGAGVAAWVVVTKRAAEPPKPVAAPEAAAVPDAPPTVRRVRPPRPRRANPSSSAGPSSPAPSSLDSQIGATIRRNQSGIRVCYDRALKRNDGLALRLDVNVRMRASGDVEEVSIDGPEGATALTACIRNVIRTWRFPPAPEPYASKFPLLLQPGL